MRSAVRPHVSVEFAHTLYDALADCRCGSPAVFLKLEPSAVPGNGLIANRWTVACEVDCPLTLHIEAYPFKLDAAEAWNKAMVEAVLLRA